jgi:hypothetical protein
MPQLVVTHDGGGTDSVPSTVAFAQKETLGEKYRLTIELERTDAESLNLVEKSDEVQLSGYKNGVLTNVDKGGSTWTLTVYSPEWYATLNEPVDGGTRVQGDDNTLITNEIGRVSEWSVGSIDDLTGPMTFVFNHAFADETIRKIEKNVPGELEFEGDGTVNYVSQRGTDRSGSVTISPASGNLEKSIRITERGRKLDATHVRVIGAHEGEAQFFANLVPSSDGATYENRVDYTTSRWSSGDVRDWDRWQNKDVMSQDTIEEEAAALADELKEEYVEVKTTVSGVDLNLGDTVHVEKTENGVKVLDRDMRVHQLTTRSIDGTPAGTEQEVTLSTRTVAREELNSDKRDIQRFNTAFQGSSVVIQGGGSRQPVNASLNAEIPFYYPNVEFENNAELFVRGLPYRAYSSGAASGGGSTVTSQNNADFSNVADTESSVSGFSSSGFGTVDTFTPSVDSSELYVFGSVTSVSGEGTFSFDYRLENTTTGNFVPNSNGFTATSQETTDREVFLVEATDVNGDAIEFQMDTAGNSAAITLYYLATGQHTHRVMFPNHTHPVDAGIIEFGAETPSNVDVLVDGTTVATNIGSGTFETTVNLDGDLTTGAWNDIELSSDSLGHLQATVSIQAYDQIGGK